jgi:imidazolonepropionase-like amidohydrolase
MDVWKTLLGARRPEELDSRSELAYLPRAMVHAWHSRTADLSRASILHEGLVSLGIRRSPSALAELRDRMLAALYRAGARLLLGSDSPQVYSVPGFSLAHELRAMVGAGLPIYTVLEAATRGPAEYFGQTTEFGMVAVGLRADLILLDGNPLEDVRNVHRQAGVMLRGCWLPKAEIDRRLGQIAAKFRVGS